MYRQCVIARASKTMLLMAIILVSACGGNADGDGGPDNSSTSNSSTSNSSTSNSSTSNSSTSNSSTPVITTGNAQSGKGHYQQLCQDCHGANGQGIHPLDIRRFSEATLAIYIAENMPKGTPDDCLGACATDAAGYILSGFQTGDSQSSGDHSSVSHSSTPANTITRGAQSKRLTADMLQQSLPVLLGRDGADDIQWTISSGRRVNNAFDQMAQTLGRPDYVEVTEEVRDVTALYVKLTTDMSLDTCAKAISRDYRASDSQSRDIVRFSELTNVIDNASILANLRYLKLRFHAEKISANDAESVSDLKAVFDAVASEAGARDAWQTVCVALLRSPQFHVY